MITALLIAVIVLGVPTLSFAWRSREFRPYYHVRAQGIKTNETGIDTRTGKHVIDEAVIRRIFINATVEQAIDTWISVVMPGLSRLETPYPTPFWKNLKPGELEAGDITDAGVDETDEWRWTFEHLNVSNHLAGLGCKWGARTGARRTAAINRAFMPPFCRATREKSN